MRENVLKKKSHVKKTKNNVKVKHTKYRIFQKNQDKSGVIFLAPAAFSLVNSSELLTH